MFTNESQIKYLFRVIAPKIYLICPLLVLCIILYVYWEYRINVHTWESYFYAGSIDHFIPPSHMAPPGRNLSLPFNDLICIYYAQHPMLYMTVYLCHTYLWPQISPLEIAQTINILSGILGLWGVFLILKKIVNSIVVASLGMMMIAWVDVYWYQSISGEVYIGAFAFLTLSMTALLEIDLSKPYNVSSCFILMSIFFGIAVCFHLYASLFGIVIAVDILCRNPSQNTLSFPFNYSKKIILYRVWLLFLLAMISMAFFCLAYVIPYFVLTSINHLGELFTLLFIHSTFWGIWQIPDHIMPVETVFALGLACKHILHAIIAGNTIISHLLRCMAGLWIGNRILKYLFAPQKERIPTLCLIWFGVYIVVLSTLVHVPTVNDNWCLSLFPILLFMIYGYRSHIQSQKGKYVVVGIIIVLFMVNGRNDIFPKNQVSEVDFFFAKGLEKQLSQYSQILLMGNHNILSQAWYIYYNNQVQLGYLHPPYEYPDLVRYQQDLLEWADKAIKNQNKVLLISSENIGWLRLTIHLLRGSGYRIAEILHRPMTIKPEIYKVSLGIVETDLKFNFVVYEISL
ncbi:MAG: hypothetical protein OMM_00287 [Candidatus Magnetoglobus multicellularis str. Araruama]|uniref:Uncharacterized protein n=1 Tax=Candidatus Magnetoglobus multicellularis str. Araruama TaxID=890399 RepID=A0A1V1PHG5_9BACT|nr:MAG: hypothetical protein OMM_00287 [Candidatus Magnetoglobus multicellularis str. Araruama]